MSVLEELAQYLEDAGVGTVATDIFGNGIPEDDPNDPVSDTLLALEETPGLPPSFVHGGDGVDFENPSVQVYARAGEHDYDAAKTLAMAAFTALNKITNETLSGTRYLSVRAVQSPYSIGVDDNGRHIITFSVNCSKDVS